MDPLFTARVVPVDCHFKRDFFDPRSFGIVIAANEPHNLGLVTRHGFATHLEVHNIAGTAVNPVAVPHDAKHTHASSGKLSSTPVTSFQRRRNTSRSASSSLS